ncbi:MAG: S8 family serine peptidase [Saprospiraceae bacterium]|nr:S8 family serine peptidase [Saprospiraceae bacterium]
MKNFFTTLFLLMLLVGFVSGPLSAQQLNHVQGELLVRLQDDANVRDWLISKQEFNRVPTQLKLRKKISAPMNIYAVTFDWTNIDENAFLQAIKRSNAVVEAQFNHFVSLRETIPNDEQFVDQWQYINTGQSGGTAGADIDMELAWDTTTGGLTPDGDTIVVCIIDGGYQITHEDLSDNVWFNYAEIPGNGIDDDNNGFVDDFKGWNTGSDADNIDVGVPIGHGTPVAGIVGAKGNNEVGVAGVNWNVKLMLVSGGSGVESEVLEAYSYPLGFRKKYNETNGEEGAFVVATNASWGVDFGQPDDAPLWCAFYDTLGVHGILNCGATINGNQDIDIVGDLPTACPSDFLISVTNMNDDDVKVTSAGFGIVNVDLGAFGAGTWTTSSGGGYGGFGGTSGATPHVTGTVALLYSAPCSNLTDLAKASPGDAALLVKQYILEGVDPNESLDGITVTGGRLNVNNSMQLLMANCGPCPNPSGLAATEVIDTSAVFSWTNTENAISDTLRWRAVGDMEWNVVADATSPYSIDSLMACTDYEFQVISNCDTILSEYSNVLQFKTDGCCENPMEFTLLTVTDSSASLSWDSILAAQSYNIRLRPLGEMQWDTLNTSTETFELTGLDSCVTYEVQIQTVCADDEIAFSESLTFTTKGCGACIDMEYCMAPGISSNEEWIEMFSLNGMENISGNNDSYGDFTGGMAVELATNNSFDFTLIPAYTGTNYDEQIRIWIDYNQDGVFAVEDELAYSIDGIDSETTGSISIPGDALTGLTRLRVTMAFAGSPDPCVTPSGGTAFGETEDYCVVIVEGVAPCEAPITLDTTGVTEAMADFTWEMTTGATEYQLRYKQETEMDWTELDVNTNGYTLEGLAECTAYETQVRSICGDSLSGYSESFMFSTDCLTSTNDLLSEFNSINIAPNPFKNQLQVRFTWSTTPQNVQVELMNYLGQTLQSKVLNDQSDVQEVTFDGSGLPSGVYLVRLQTTDGKVHTQKVVKTF